MVERKQSRTNENRIFPFVERRQYKRGRVEINGHLTIMLKFDHKYYSVTKHGQKWTLIVRDHCSLKLQIGVEALPCIKILSLLDNLVI